MKYAIEVFPHRGWGDREVLSDANLARGLVTACADYVSVVRGPQAAFGFRVTSNDGIVWHYSKPIGGR